MAGIKTAGNLTVTYNSNAITAYCNTAAIASQLNQIDTTDLASTAMESIPGLANWSVDCGGNWDPTFDAYLRADMVAPPSTLRTLAVVVGIGGSTVTYTWTANAYVSDWNVDASSPSDGLTWTSTITCSGAPAIS